MAISGVHRERKQQSMRYKNQDTHLDALVAAQEEDGGWPINWQVWTPITGLEWRGWATIEALKTLQAYGRLS